MEVRTVDPKRRFDATVFDPRTEYWQSEICIADYTCPTCAYRVRFTTHDFFGNRSPSPFSDKLREAMDLVRPLDQMQWELPFDFYCPKCGLPIRIIWQHQQEFAMGCYTYCIVAVVEAVQ